MYTTFTITEICKPSWHAGMLQDNVAGNGFTASCNCSLYRSRMQATTVTLKGSPFRRGFALASMPIDWTPKVGDVVRVHESQM